MHRSKGFTLVEAAVAIGVVAILSGIIIPLVLKNLNDGRRARALNDLHVISAALASQMRDTASRPVAAGGGAGVATGAGNATWQSLGNQPTNWGGGALALTANNTFEALFGSAPALGNALFRLDPARRPEFQYRGPYLGHDMLLKTDPWGNAYLIFGYNEDGQATGGPIWVVCAGELGTVAQNNVAVGGIGAPNVGQHRQSWDYTLPGSEHNLVVRVN